MLIDEKPYKQDLMELLEAQANLAHESMRSYVVGFTDFDKKGALQVRVLHLLEEFAKKWNLACK